MGLALSGVRYLGGDAVDMGAEPHRRSRMTWRFGSNLACVSEKSQLDLQALYRVRSRLVSRRVLLRPTHS